MKEKKYLNVATGSVDTREGWDYVNEKGEEVNAVDLGEVVPVCWNNETGSWELEYLVQKVLEVFSGSKINAVYLNEGE